MSDCKKYGGYSPAVLTCGYCEGTGKIEMDNNGPIVSCPLCGAEDDEKVYGPFDNADELFDALRPENQSAAEVTSMATHGELTPLNKH